MKTHKLLFILIVALVAISPLHAGWACGFPFVPPPPPAAAPLLPFVPPPNANVYGYGNFHGPPSMYLNPQPPVVVNWPTLIHYLRFRFTPFFL